MNPERSRHAFSKRLSAVSRLLAALLGLFLLNSGLSVRAETGRWADSEQASVRLISSTDAVGEAKTLSLGLEFQMQEGWKIYWRSPGDAGFPPKPDWSQSENITNVAMQWPAPMRFSLFGMQTVGYEDQVIFPLTVAVERPGAPVRLAARIEYLVCDDEICVPGEADVSLSLKAGATTIARSAHALDRFAARVPVSEKLSGLTVTQATVTEARSDDKLTFGLALRAEEPLGEVDAFVEGPDALYLEAPEITYSEDRRQAVLRYIGGGVSVGALLGKTVTITAVTTGATHGATNGDTNPRSLETMVPVESGSIADLLPIEGSSIAGASLTGNALWAMVGIALLGGLILNLMPCVLPVLSLKILQAVQSGGMVRHAARANFMASALGVVSCFLVMAFALIALKAAGASIGWGIQFQNGPFLAFMIVILFLFAGNLVGLFEIQLPSRWTTRLATVGASADVNAASSDESQKATPVAHFASGAFAALLATPCSAPFLGTAVGFALSQGPSEVLIIFAALGFGLAAPYLLLAISPRLVTGLPKPGAWMVKLKWVLAAALAGTALWLWSVLRVVIGLETALGVLALAMLAVAVIALHRLPQSRLGRIGPVMALGLGLAAILAPVMNVTPTKPEGAAPSIDAGVRWVAFDPAALEHYRQAGSVVFVDVTADWCITCKFNKKTVLDRSTVSRLLAAEGVVAMQADWTRPDEKISAFLARHDRYGIPFNRVYGPGAPEGVALSELLSVDAVSAAILKAAEGSPHAGPLAALASH